MEALIFIAIEFIVIQMLTVQTPHDDMSSHFTTDELQRTLIKLYWWNNFT